METPSKPTRRDFLTGLGAAASVAALARPIDSLAALEAVLAVDTTAADNGFWSQQPRARFVVLGDFGSGFVTVEPNGLRTDRINPNAKAVADGIYRVLPQREGGPIICVGDAIYVPFDGQPSAQFPGWTSTWLAENLTPYDQAVGTLYHRYIEFPRNSRSRFARRGARTQRFLTLLGDHDWWHVPRTEVTDRPVYEMDTATYGQLPIAPQARYALTADAPYRDYFGNQGGNLRYFRRREGDAEWFALSSDANEVLLGTLDNAYYLGPFPDGYHPGLVNEQRSKQGRWFRAAARRSRARWKFVNTHYPPHTSSRKDAPGDSHNPAIYMRWNYARHGIDAVFSGHVHAYERFYVGGVTYIVNGAGGTFEDFASYPSPAPGSQRRVTNRYGFLAADEPRPGTLLFRYYVVNAAQAPGAPQVRDHFALVKGGTLTAEDLPGLDAIHVTRGGARLAVRATTTFTGALLGTGRLRKSGAGRLALAGSGADFTGRVEVESGALAINAPLAPRAAYVLGGGTLELAVAQVSSRPLTLVAPSTLLLGERATLTVAASRSQTWNGPLTVEGFRPGALRIGRSADALTPAQFAAIRFAEEPTATARLDAQGFLVRVP